MDSSGSCHTVIQRGWVILPLSVENMNGSCVSLIATTVAVYLSCWNRHLLVVTYCRWTSDDLCTGIFIQLNNSDHLQYFCDICITENCSLKFCKINPSSLMSYLRTTYRRVENFWIVCSMLNNNNNKIKKKTYIFLGWGLVYLE
jgi:hypothetical protein